jgi:Rps23 Pro-64 3,4-dihydroxylase Tpa1-like proline 4-hydroxylase
MSQYDSLYEKGYYFGNLSELDVNMEEFIEISNAVYSFEKDRLKYFDYFNVCDDKMPHKIPYSEKQDRINYLENNPQVTACNSSHNLLVSNETKYCIDYFQDVVSKFFHKIHSDYTEEKFKNGDIKTNSGIQMYDNGCYQNAHTDGHVGEFVIIIYFSDPSNYNNTGRLEILKDSHSNEEIIDFVDPVLGKFSIFEVVKNNVRHRVQKVDDDFIRFSFLAQIRKNF